MKKTIAVIITIVLSVMLIPILTGTIESVSYNQEVNSFEFKVGTIIAGSGDIIDGPSGDTYSSLYDFIVLNGKGGVAVGGYDGSSTLYYLDVKSIVINDVIDDVNITSMSVLTFTDNLRFYTSSGGSLFQINDNNELSDIIAAYLIDGDEVVINFELNIPSLNSTLIAILGLIPLLFGGMIILYIFKYSNL